jgi:glucan 1,3-beta-glucosidase
MLTKLALGAAAAARVEAKAPNRAMTGTNAGGWQVLEPWITPSLFYRFLGKEKGQVGMDSYTFCEALGPVEGNKVMRAHWDAWFTEAHFKELAEKELEIIRLPIGDWTLEPYGPFIGCMDGAAEKIEWFYDMAHKNNIKVLMDLHAIKDSQNGYDNSGRANQITWTDNTHYHHDVYGEWWGEWQADT